MEPNVNESQGTHEQLETTAARAVEVTREQAGRAAEVVRGTTGNLQALLADALEDGAKALRERGGGEGRAAGGAAAGESRLARLPAGEVAVATALERSAMWLRENDLAELGTLARRQAREHPARTALIALGLGFLFGRAARRD
jgi:hypothetical protein